MFKSIRLIVAILSFVILAGIAIAASSPATDDLKNPADLTAHEWGTFTTIAGLNGESIDWLPLGGPTDLPCFVKHFDATNAPKRISPLNLLSYSDARSQLTGSVRMETPVLYFYSSQEQKLQVKVDFPHGIVTEWYPAAAVTPSFVNRSLLTSAENTGASITWSDVRVKPSATANFPQGSTPSHYYAARATDAAPVQVKDSTEKFLFYRGVGKFPSLIRAVAQEDGKILVRDLQDKSTVILFESRGSKLGYRMVSTENKDALLDPPALTSDFAALRRELEAALIGQGLYGKEATAMVDTWRDSWFEEGTRLFYIVPPAKVDALLPLAIDPKPAHVTRVFVGRVELLTPTTIAAVRQAITANDAKTLQVYGRFLGPISERLKGQVFSGSDRIPQLLDATLKSYAADLAVCSK